MMRATTWILGSCLSLAVMGCDGGEDQGDGDGECDEREMVDAAELFDDVNLEDWLEHGNLYSRCSSDDAVIEVFWRIIDWHYGDKAPPYDGYNEDLIEEQAFYNTCYMGTMNVRDYVGSCSTYCIANQTKRYGPDCHEAYYD